MTNCRCQNGTRLRCLYSFTDSVDSSSQGHEHTGKLTPYTLTHHPLRNGEARVDIHGIRERRLRTTFCWLDLPGTLEVLEYARDASEAYPGTVLVLRFNYVGKMRYQH